TTDRPDPPRAPPTQPLRRPLGKGDRLGIDPRLLRCFYAGEHGLEDPLGVPLLADPQPGRFPAALAGAVSVPDPEDLPPSVDPTSSHLYLLRRSIRSAAASASTGAGRADA